MCVVSMVIDHFRDKPYWPKPWHDDMTRPLTNPPPSLPYIPSKADFDELKRDVEELKSLIKRAKKYDAENGEPDCEMAEKVAIVKKVAKLVGVDISDVL